MSTVINDVSNMRGAFRLISTDDSWSTAQYRTISHVLNTGALAQPSVGGRVWMMAGDIDIENVEINATIPSPPTVPMIIPPTRSTANTPPTMGDTANGDGVANHPASTVNLAIGVVRGDGTVRPAHRGRWEIEARSDGRFHQTAWSPAPPANANTANVTVVLNLTDRFRLLTGARYRAHLNSFTTNQSTEQVGRTHISEWAEIIPPHRITATVADVTADHSATTLAVVVGIQRPRAMAQIRVRLIMERQAQTGTAWHEVMRTMLWNPAGTTSTMTINAANLNSIRNKMRDGTTTPMRLRVITEAANGTTSIPPTLSEQIGETQIVPFTLTLTNVVPVLGALTATSHIVINRVISNGAHTNSGLPVVRQVVLQTGLANVIRSLSNRPEDHMSRLNFNNPTITLRSGATLRSEDIIYAGRTVRKRVFNPSIPSEANVVPASVAIGAQSAQFVVEDNRSVSATSTLATTVLAYTPPTNTSTATRNNAVITINYTVGFSAVNPNIAHGNVPDIPGTNIRDANITANGQTYRGFRWRIAPSGNWSVWSNNGTLATATVNVGDTNRTQEIDVEIAYYDRFRGVHVTHRLPSVVGTTVIQNQTITAPSATQPAVINPTNAGNARLEVATNAAGESIMRLIPNGGLNSVNINTFTMHNDGNPDGQALTIQSGGQMFVGAGESPRALRTALNETGINGTQEVLYLSSDSTTQFYTNAQNINNRRRALTVRADGRLEAPYMSGEWVPRIHIGDVVVGTGSVIGDPDDYTIHTARWSRFGNQITVSARFDITIRNDRWRRAWLATTSTNLTLQGLPAPVWGLGLSGGISIIGLSWTPTNAGAADTSGADNSPGQNLAVGGQFTLRSSSTSNVSRLVIRRNLSNGGLTGCANLTRANCGSQWGIAGSMNTATGEATPGAQLGTTGELSNPTAQVRWRIQLSITYNSNTV
jgi:hypothetical protein